MVTIIRPEPLGKQDWVADKRYYLDKNGNVVGDKDPARVSLLIAAGCTMPIERARKYGLVKDAEPEPAPAPSGAVTPVIVELPPVVKTQTVIESPKPMPDTKPAKKPAKKAKK